MGNERFDVVALGELLIDFTENGRSGQGNPLFEANPGADMMLTEAELPLDAIANSHMFHFGTLSMTHEDVRKATCKAIACAKQGGALLSFDPNLRPPLWDSLEEAIRSMPEREQVLSLLNA